MTLKDRLTEYVRACFTGLWIESHEHEDALREMAQLCAEQDWRLMTWNIDSGLAASGQSGDAEPSASDPLAAIRTLRSASGDTATLLVLSNFHRFLNSAEIVQALAEQLVSGKQTRTFIVVLSPVVAIPVELEKLFVVVEHQLPDREQLHDIATGIAAEEGELPTGTELDTVLDAACGLTRYEAENAFSLSLVRHNRITSEAVWELKSGMLKKSGLLELHRGQDDFEALGGLNSLKL